MSWKKINHELSEAAKIGSYEKILSAAWIADRVYTIEHRFAERTAGENELFHS